MTPSELNKMLDELEIKYDDAFERNTRATGGGYEADTTSQYGLWRELKMAIIEFAEQYHLKKVNP